MTRRRCRSARNWLMLGAMSEAAFWMTLAWTAIIGMAVVGRWKPRHTHPDQAQCRCLDCAMRRLER